MEISLQQKMERYENANMAQKFLFAHYSSGAALQTIAEKYDLTEPATYKIFALLVGDFVLGFYQQTDYITALQQIPGVSQHMATLLYSDVIQFLSPLTDPTWKPPKSESDEGSDETNNPSLESSDLMREIVATEEAMNSIPPIRVIPDVGLELDNTYSTTQAAILNEGQRQTKATDIEAHWDTSR